ncbi:MAG: DUF4268 domain-containing protein [Reyranella sp.]|uniref:DUF4268 domain-containing protein n=1 Tax=Reyranella sp. TaxID=1929291 RepID=UPI0012291E1F|nr:DUF4268 domain-containing protein [Reyranella sp.]TAJ86349.1 MAG: DUF4268 domain-containing protein [Reyranella sp.]TBR26293.1 MAG: DUF4268 domain-containing protein [Reyranella sp.]
MTLYRVTASKLESVSPTNFAAERLLERRDLQRLLRQDISAIGEDLMVIDEEYGNWEDSNRRIDLLCLSKKRDLVVVEIKRTEDGGHMELQAIRYAAMVSSMTLEKVIHAHARAHDGDPETARSEILGFLELDFENEAELTGTVRIVLVAANFSPELTTAVLWLNKRGVDITCIRLRPYKMGNDVLIDVTQIIPLPESADYEVKLREQDEEKRKVVGARQEIFRKFWTQFIDRSKSHTQLLANRSTTTEQWISAGIGRGGFRLNIALTENNGQIRCFIRPGSEQQNSAAFSALLAQKSQIETRFGGELVWDEVSGRLRRSIGTELPGGWASPEVEWPEIQDRMIDTLVRLEGALRLPIQQLQV